MDIYEYLKMDHKKVAKLFELYESAASNKNKLEIIVMLDKELQTHADSEAATFYKILETHRKSDDAALHGEEEHEEIKKKLKSITSHTAVDAHLDKKMKELKKLVEHHVSDEEGKIFRAAKKVLSDEEALIIKLQMHDMKEKLLHGINIRDKAELESS